MKSSFLIALALTSSLSAWGQTKKDPAVADSVVVHEKDSLDRFLDRLKISYFGAYQGSSIGQWDNLAIDEKGAKDPTYAHNLFNQISFNYNFGAKLNFVLNPRFTLYTGRTSGHQFHSRGVFVLEDLLAGFQGVQWSSEDKKFNLWNRIAARLPTSRSSRNSNITLQPEYFAIASYDIDKKWQLGSYIQLRQWVYEERFTAFRYRTYFAPYIQMAINDTTRLQLFYENYLENRQRLESQNGKKQNLQSYWQTVMLALSKDVTPKLNFMPFLVQHVNTKTHLDERPLDDTGVGFWLSYQIK